MSYARTFIGGVANLLVFIVFNIAMMYFAPVWAAQGLTVLIFWLIVSWVVLQLAVLILTWIMIKAGESAAGGRRTN